MPLRVSAFGSTWEGRQRRGLGCSQGLGWGGRQRGRASLIKFFHVVEVLCTGYALPTKHGSMPKPIPITRAKSVDFPATGARVSSTP